MHREGMQRGNPLAKWKPSALGGRLAVWFNRSPRGQIIMQRVAGCVFVAMAAALLLSSR